MACIAFLTFLARWPDARMIYRRDADDWARTSGATYEDGWNHTTLRAIKVNPDIIYLQVRCAGPDFLDKVQAIRTRFGPDLIQHLEMMREGGHLTAAALTLVRFTSEERLDQIIHIHEDIGCMVFNPHRYTLKERGRQTVDARQLAFKREADPKGLLNTGKMVAWDAPDWDYSGIYDCPGLRRSRRWWYSATPIQQPYRSGPRSDLRAAERHRRRIATAGSICSGVPTGDGPRRMAGLSARA